MEYDDKRHPHARIRLATGEPINPGNSRGPTAIALQRPLRVLVVSHSDRDAAQVLSALRQGGFDVQYQRVSEDDDFEAALSAQAWDLVVAEYHMAQWRGEQALQRTQSIAGDVPVVLMCGAIGEDAAAIAIKRGASDCIGKSQLRHRLASSVRQELDRRVKSVAATRSPGSIGVPANDAANRAREALPAGLQQRDASCTLQLDRTGQQQAIVPLPNIDAVSRSIFDSSPVALLLLLPFSHITCANDKMVELSGYSRAEMLGSTVDELQLRVNDGLGLQVLARLRHEEDVDAIEMNLRRKDGTLRRVLLSSRMMDVGGVRQRLHSLADISAQKAAMDESRLVRQAMASISQGVLISGSDGLSVSINAAFESMTGYTEKEVVGKPCTMLQGAGTDPQVAQAIRAAIGAGEAFSGEILNYRKDGTSFWNELAINPVRDEDGRLTHFVAIQRNISERRRQDSQIRLAAQIFAQSREGVTVTDAQNRIVMVNEAFTAISGYTESEVLGKDPRAMDSVAIDDERYRAKWQTIRETGRWQGDTVARRKDGTTYPESLTISVIRDETGNVCNYVRTFSDLSMQRAANERIEHLSHFDALTDLPNRNLLADRCEHDIKAAKRDATPLAMLMVGIDQFKMVNDTLGPVVGDHLLRLFAARLSTSVREMDTVARVGGDEFVLVLPGETAEGAHLLAERLLQGLSQPFMVDNTPVTVSASVGIAVYPPDGLDFPGLFKSAQLAMHQAKDRGRANVRFFSADMFQQTVELAALGTELRQAVSRDQLYLHYQPFADLRTGRIGGMEALLRWSHPELGTVSPARFIPVAERLGLIVDIGHWVLRQTCMDARRWRLSGLQVPPISVNLSPVQFRDPALARQVATALTEFEMDPASLCLELTEGALMDDVAHSETLMRELKTLGVGLSLDDFGTGYSSLSYLKRYPFDKVKIDQSFVRGIHANSQDAVIAKVVISMAHGLGLRAIAEGVETELQCEFMRSNMCDEIQGYFFSRPIPAHAMAGLLQEDRCLPAHLVRAQERTRTLLVVDAEPNVASALKRLLRSDGYRILTAGSGAQGLEVLTSNPVDIIVADQRMAGMTGLEFLRQAKLSHPQTIRIVLSGHTELQSVTDAINEGAVYRFLTKPWDDAQLCGIIRDAFRHKELADENESLNRKIRVANQELAASNRQLQEVLDHKQHELSRGADSLGVMQEALHNIPLPILAIEDGVIVFANLWAQELVGQSRTLLLSPVGKSLPSLGAAMAGANEGDGIDIDIAGKTCRAKWHRLGKAARCERMLVVFGPASGPPEAVTIASSGDPMERSV